MDTPTLIRKAEYRASWRRLAHSASLMSPLRPQRSGEWGEVRWGDCVECIHVYLLPLVYIWSVIPHSTVQVVNVSHSKQCVLICGSFKGTESSPNHPALQQTFGARVWDLAEQIVNKLWNACSSSSEWRSWHARAFKISVVTWIQWPVRVLPATFSRRWIRSGVFEDEPTCCTRLCEYPLVDTSAYVRCGCVTAGGLKTTFNPFRKYALLCLHLLRSKL